MSKASDGIKAVSKVHAPKPDVILLAMMMPRKDDLGTIEDVMKDQPVGTTCLASACPGAQM